MQTISEFLSPKSKRDNVNIIIQESGSMSNENEHLKKIINVFKSKNVSLYGFKDNKVHPVESFDELNFSGPHVKDFEDLNNFYNQNLGSLNIFIGN